MFFVLEKNKQSKLKEKQYIFDKKLSTFPKLVANYFSSWAYACNMLIFQVNFSLNMLLDFMLINKCK